jgi:hypothetical protein
VELDPAVILNFHSGIFFLRCYGMRMKMNLCIIKSQRMSSVKLFFFVTRSNIITVSVTGSKAVTKTS